MKILEIDYRKLIKQEECLKILPYEFVEKYNCLIYCKYENGYVVLITNNFEFYNINKLSFFIKKEIYLCYIKNEEWISLLENLKLNTNINNAVDKFNINKDIKIHS